MQLKAMGAMTYEECLAYGDFTVQTFAKAQMECELLDLISYAQGRYWLKA
jgi:alpha-acetolactate decarboxylase